MTMRMKHGEIQPPSFTPYEREGHSRPNFPRVDAFAYLLICLIANFSNVREWVADWYDEAYYERSPDRNPKGPQDGKTRVLRGGSWQDRMDDVRCATRHHDAPNTNGFPSNPEALAELSALKAEASSGAMGFAATNEFMEGLEKHIRYYGFRCAMDAIE